MKINYQKFAAFVLAALVLVVPVLVFGQDMGDEPVGGLVPCGNPGQSPCRWVHLVQLVHNVIEFLLFTVAIPLCAVAIVWAGIKLVMNPSSSTAKGEVKEIVVAACLGLAIALASYLLVDTILKAFTTETLEGLKQDINARDQSSGNDASVD